MTLQHWIDDLRRLEKAMTAKPFFFSTHTVDGSPATLSGLDALTGDDIDIASFEHWSNEDGPEMAANAAGLCAARNALLLLLDVAEALHGLIRVNDEHDGDWLGAVEKGRAALDALARQQDGPPAASPPRTPSPAAVKEADRV